MSLDENLKKYDLFQTLSRVSSLLIFPELQANSYRIEQLIYLIILNCKKSKIVPKISEIENWLNKNIDKRAEDPIEDVFVTNILTPFGNYKIFKGSWVSNDFFTQKTINVISSKTEYKELLLHVFNLLKISNSIIERVGLKRWDYSEKSIPQVNMKLSDELNKEMNRVVFSLEDLKSLNIPIKLLSPFIFRPKDIETLKNYGNSVLEEKPLIFIDNKIIVALPNAIGSAIRKYVISEFKKSNSLNMLEKLFFEYEVKLIETPRASPLFSLLLKTIDHKVDHNIALLKDWLVKYDLDKYLHVVLLHFPIELNNSPIDKNKKILKYIDEVSKFCESQSDFEKGQTLIIIGSDGLKSNKINNDLTNNRKSWYTSFISTYDFLKLSSPFDKRTWSLKGYLKFLSQKEYLENKGMKFQSIDGDYNLYCLWHVNNCNLMLKNSNFNTYLYSAPDMQFSLNYKVRKTLDIHVSRDINNQYFPVEKYYTDSYFPKIAEAPVYISLHHLFDKNILKIIVENKSKNPKWLAFKCNQTLMETCHTLIDSGLGILYKKIISEIEKIYTEKAHTPLEICLNLEEVKLNDELFKTEQIVKNPEILFDFEKNMVEIKFPKNFFINFDGYENKGEKEIIKYITIALICLYNKKEGNIDQNILNFIVNKIVRENIRIFHVFKGDILHHFLHKNKMDFEFPVADGMFTKIKILNQYINEIPGTVLKGKEAQNFINNLFKKIVSHIQSKLQMLNRNLLLHELIAIHESGIYEDTHWKKTIGAVLSLYEDGKKTAEIKNRERDAIKKSCQFLLEMAICECPENGGKRVSEWDIEELLATTFLLLEVAIDSDILKHKLCKSEEIKIEANKEYIMDKSFINNLTRFFVKNLTFSFYKKQRNQYKNIYEKRTLENLKERKELENINDAFVCEFGLSIEEVSQICNTLFSIACKKDDMAVETTVSEIIGTCKENNISHKAIMSFINSFSIFYRPKWENPPDGFNPRDISPFKYNRRLAFNVKPLLTSNTSNNSKVFYGIGNVYKAIHYILHQVMEGNFPAEFFKSIEMKTLYGKINEKKGEEFNNKVSNKLKNLGWNVRENIIMSQIKAPKKLGDIDVLAWKGKQVLIVESKRLQTARNTNEIINSLQRFKGEKNDLLHKHINRVDWIKDNSHSIKEIVGFLPNKNDLKGVIVTNILIPSQYVDLLPIKNNPILQLEDLENSKIENLFKS